MVLQKMIEEEFRENKSFKFPEEYDVFDDEENKACKIREGQKMRKYDFSQSKVIRDKFKVKDDQALYYEKQAKKTQREQEKELDRFLYAKVQEYYVQMKKRLI